MRPRREMVCLDTALPLADCMRLADETRYSRLPLCELGNPDRILGVVHVKDLFARRDTAMVAGDLRPAAKPVIYVPETARLDRLLQAFLERRLHFAVVVDEYGGTTGMVTLENVLEELVGQIQDEFDQEKPRVEKSGEDSWILDGALPLFELSELVRDTLEAPGTHTVGGWMTHRLGGFAKVGDSVEVSGHRLTVSELDNMRIVRIALRRERAHSGTFVLRLPSGPGAAEA
jgi:CBS domain containing-hemolysin-like protein